MCRDCLYVVIGRMIRINISIPPKYLKVLLLALIWTVGLLAVTLQAWSATAKPVVLFVPSVQPIRFPDKIARELRMEGFVTAGHPSFNNLSLGYLRQFNTVVVYYQKRTPALTPVVKRSLKALQTYVKEGGGLLVTKDLYSRRGRAFFHALLAPLGAKILVEQIDDLTSIYAKTAYGKIFAWTNQIRPHPVTKGVTGLCYNLDRWEEGEPGVLPVKVTDDWQVLVKGMPTASTFMPMPAELKRMANAGHGTYAASPPLLAVRQVGKGRIGIWPTLPSFTLMDGYSMILDNGIVMDSKRGDKRSDGAKLTYNLLHWLAEPSLSMPAFGHFQAPPLPKSSLHNPGCSGMDWSKLRDFGPAFSHAYMGLIGAKTGLSTGQGTPEQFVAAAKTAGYDFIAFCEDINLMPKENWQKLLTACKKATNAHFLAMPGYYYKDNAGDAFVVIGTTEYPAPEWADPKNPKEKILYNGTIRMASKQTPPIIMLPLPTNTRPARYHSSFYGFAYQVWEDGKLVVEDWRDYVELQKEGLSLFPTSVHLVKSPEEVAQARREGMQAYVRADTLNKLLTSIDDLSSAHRRWFKPAYPSSGPEICTLYAKNWGTSDQAIPGNDRFRLQVMVRSKMGLTEVSIYDRGQLYRRFLPHEAKEFKRNLDDYHSQQHNFIVVAKDVAGGKAISWGRDTQVQECWFWMCSDNMNDMGPGGKILLDKGRVHLAGTEFSIVPFGPGVTAPWPSVEAKLKDGTRIVNPKFRAGMKDCSLVSRFGMVVNYPLEYCWDGPGVTGAVYPSHLSENPFLGGTYRYYSVARRPPGPDLEVREYTVKIRQDMEFVDTPGLRLLGSHNWQLKRPDQLDHLVYFSGKRESIVENPTRDEKPRRFMVTVHPGEYAAIYPMCTAVFPLDQDLQVTFYRKPTEPYFTLLQAGIGKKGEKLSAGTVVHARFALVSLPFAAEGEYTWLPEHKQYWHSKLLADDICGNLGLSGPPAYKVVPTVGKVIDTHLFLHVQTEECGFRATIGTCHLPVGLPVIVSGVNPRWSAGVWYRGKHTFLQTEWPPGYFKHEPVNRRYVQHLAETDAIYRFGSFDGDQGFLQLQTELDDKDVFIGNLITCDRHDFILVFLRDRKTGKFMAEVHNPTNLAATVTVRPGRGFDLLGNFSRKVELAGGSSVLVGLP
jgi:hypothetical protein